MPSPKGQGRGKKTIGDIPMPTVPTQELKKDYISLTEGEIRHMLETVGANSLEELFAHIPADLRFSSPPSVCSHLPRPQLLSHLQDLANKNRLKSCFIGDALKWYSVHPIVSFVSGVRGLSTAYTPYQPERCQGTLKSLWMYSSALSQLTGFEAINASFYERSTCLFEAANTALRIKKRATTVLLSEGLHPQDLEVMQTLAAHTPMRLETFPLDARTGQSDLTVLNGKLEQLGEEVAALIYPHSNCLGLLEDVHRLTDTVHQHGALAIAVVDPMLLGPGGLVPPSQYGEKGADMLVGEGQHLAIGPHFGGPGLGVFGIRFNSQNRTAIRATAGRFVGKATDAQGRECLCMVLSTREQHIRREKATSNICSNQSFLATLAGASLLARGDRGLGEVLEKSRVRTLEVATVIQSLDGLDLAFPHTPFFNELCLSYRGDLTQLLQRASIQGIQLGVDVSERVPAPGNYLLLFFNDAQTDGDIEKLKTFLASELGNGQGQEQTSPVIPPHLLRREEIGLPSFAESELQTFYSELGEQNVSPDDHIYPLGSCTMKYNPLINDWAASLEGFTRPHPQAPEEDVQGCLEILYYIQEYFKAITGLSAVATGPVAGAQGELVGLKMFQAYHRDRGNADKKKLILIPRSAHGTNPATATMAGFTPGKTGEAAAGLLFVDADESGQIDLRQFHTLMDEHGERVAGMMITNPNTAGIFENHFKEVADRLHAVDALVYMDGANMNAIAGQVNLAAMGVDAVHNNLHKTWSIPHGGGGPGDAIVAVSDKLADYLPGRQIVREEGGAFRSHTPDKSIGDFHRHWGNFSHKVRAYTYLRALGDGGIRRMSAIAVLSARYLLEKLKGVYPILPAGGGHIPRMHEFIITMNPAIWDKLADAGLSKAQGMLQIGKLFLDFGPHTPTVAFPEPHGFMIEPTESFDLAELDRFAETLRAVAKILVETPSVLNTAPHFTPVGKIDEVAANKNLVLSGPIPSLGEVLPNRIPPEQLKTMPLGHIFEKMLRSSLKSGPRPS